MTKQKFPPIPLLRQFSFLKTALVLLLFLTSLLSQAQSTWTTRTSAADNGWTSVTYGNGLFVAVAQTGTGNRVMTSPDGINWTSRTSATDNSWRGVTYGNGLFVAVAISGTGNRVMTSPDGIVWTSRVSAANNNWSSVTYGNGLFVAVSYTGTGNRVMTSPDGITWTSRTSAADITWMSVTYGNGLFVAVSSDGSIDRVMTSQDGFTWTSRTSTATNLWRSVTYGNNMFVAVAMSGTGNRVMTSTNGITWTSPASTPDYFWNNITYGNGLFVAVSLDGIGNRLMTSPDGIVWALQTPVPDNQWYSVTYGNGLFVAVSIDGIGNRVMSWGSTLPVTAPTLTTQAVTAISKETAKGNGNITSLGTYNPTAYGVCWNTSGSPTIANSKTDKGAISVTGAFTANMAGLTAGTTYKVRAFATNSVNTSYGAEVTFTTSEVVTIAPTVSTQAVTSIAQETATGNGNITDLGTSNPTAYGVCWNTAGSPTITDSKTDKGAISATGAFTADMTNLTPNTPYKVRAYATSSVDTSYGEEVTVTTLGIAPTVSTQAVTTIAQITAVGNGNMIALGTSNPTAYGVCWNTTGSPTILDSKTNRGASYVTGAFTATMTGLTAGTTYKVRAFATNSVNTVYGTEVTFTTVENTPGSNWVHRSAASWNNWHSITYGNGLFVAVSMSGTGNRVMTSPNGITWTSRISAADNNWSSVTYGNGLFVAVARTGTGNRVMTSPDGITWSSRTSAADNIWNSVTYGNGLFVAVASSGTGNRVMTSTDGSTWTSRTSTADNAWSSVTYGNGLFVAVSYSGTGRVMTSPDGINWTSRTSASNNTWNSITYGNGLFVAVSITGTGNRVMTSPDGSTWTSRASATDNNWISVTYGNGRFVAVSSTGSRDRVMTSPDGINWTSQISAVDYWWYGVTFGNGMFVAVSWDFGISVMTSGSVPTAPTVTTQAVTAISQETATGNGNITALGSPNPTAYGVCWNTAGTPTILDSKTDKGAIAATGAFTANMTSLTAGTTYKVRAFATNSFDTSYGTEVTFTTLGTAPTVTTQAVTAISQQTATGNGNITALGTANPTAYGVCWNTTGSPTIANIKTDKGAIAATGAFTADITGLTAGTTYYVRAFATNSVNTSYGSEVSFIFTNADKGLTDLVNPAISDIAVADGFKFTSNATGQTIHSITIQAGGKLDLTNALTVSGDVNLKADNSGSFSANIAAGLTVSGTLNYIKTMDANRWYFMSFPCNVDVNAITQVGGILGALNTAWYIKEYDGASRIVNLGTTSNWKSIVGTTLLANKGYIIALESFKGTQDISFPLDKTLVQAAENATRTISNSVITAFGAGAAVAANHKGWNLVGQPFLSKFSGANALGGAGGNALTYMSVPIGISGATYSQSVKASYSNIEPFSAYFVQVDADIANTGISFATGGRHLAPSAVEVDLSDRVQLNFTTATGTDNTNLVMDNSQTTAYEMNKDLEKMIGTGTAQPQVYTQLGGINFAYNALPAASVSNLTLGFYTKTVSETTISAVATAPSLSSLLLKDNITGTITNLLTTNYKFTPATAGTNTTRFSITAQRVINGNEVELEADAPTVVINNSKLIINNLDGKASVRVFDAIGRLVANKTVSNNTLQINLSAKGMYIVQIEVGGKSWVKKIVN